MDVKNLLDEYTYHTDNNPTLFVESPKLLEMIYKSKFDILANEIKIPINKIISIAFPQNLTVRVNLLNLSKHHSFTPSFHIPSFYHGIPLKD